MLDTLKIESLAFDFQGIQHLLLTFYLVVNPAFLRAKQDKG